MIQTKGFDISEDNGGRISFPSAKKAGFDFVFIKINEGDHYDSKASGFIGSARKAGLVVGGYNFLRPKPGRTGAQEFDLYYDRAKKLGLNRKGDIRPVADVEATGFPAGPLQAYRTRRYVRSWVERCVQRTGRHPIIYTAGWFWDGTMRCNRTFGCRLWLAAYVPEGDLFKYMPRAWRRRSPHPSFHQYTDLGKLPASSGQFDLDVYLADLPTLKKVHCL